MARVYIVDNDSVANKPFDYERTDLPYHDEIDEYDLRVRLALYCEVEEETEATEDFHTIYPWYRMTPTHTREVKTRFVLMEFPAEAVQEDGVCNGSTTNPIIAWVQIVSHKELRYTIGGVAPKCGDKIIRTLNRATNAHATHLFSNRYDETTLMPRCLHWLGKRESGGAEWLHAFKEGMEHTGVRI
jgi:hypothetical protein